MTGRIFAIIAAAAALAIAGCEGDTGSVGPTGPTGPAGTSPLGFNTAPQADQDLGEYDSGADPADPADDPADQEFDKQLADSTGVWRVTLDHVLQFNRGTGEPPVIATSVLYDTDHDVLWLTIDGVDFAFEDDGTGDLVSIGCLAGAAQPCITITESNLPALLYAAIAHVDVQFGPAIDSNAAIVVGVKTAIADMPVTGTATYLGDSHLFVSYTRPDGTSGSTEQDGTVVMDVDFDPNATIQVDWSSTLGDPTTTPDNHGLSATATIDGNSYGGVLNGTISGTTATQDDTLLVTGELEGSFYGPAADDGTFSSETAGLFSFEDTSTDSDGDTVDDAVGGGGGEFGAGQEEGPGDT